MEELLLCSTMPFKLIVAFTVSLNVKLKISDVRFSVKFCRIGGIVSLLYTAALVAFIAVTGTTGSPTISTMVVLSIVM